MRHSKKSLLTTFFFRVSCSSSCLASLTSLSKDFFRNSSSTSDSKFVLLFKFLLWLFNEMDSLISRTEFLLFSESLEFCFLLAMWFSAIINIGRGNGIRGRPFSTLSLTQMIKLSLKRLSFQILNLRLFLSFSREKCDVKHI